MDNLNHQEPSHGLTNESPKTPVVAIVIPFPCHSHLNQLLQLSCLISSSSTIPVHYAASATHLRHARLRFSTTNRLATAQIHFHELPNPSFLSPPPNPNSNSKFPSHLQPSFDASLQLRRPAAALLRQISAAAERVVVIHDLLMTYVVQDIVTLPNAESYVFSPVSAFNTLCRDKTKKPSRPEGLPSFEGCHTLEFQNFLSQQTDFLSLPTGTILNSSRAIEGAYIDLLANENKSRYQNIWAIGPLNQWMVCDNENWNTQHKCLQWLDKQAPKSVLYVSFGSVTSMSEEQTRELATGLEESGEKFIWVSRDADRGDIFAGDEKREKVLEGYEERVREVGMVVRDWAPQVEILGHPSTGGFMSHCGWNSCMESITMGVPIAAWPMHSDQPKNAFLLTDILKVGLAVNRWEHREELVTSSTIAREVKRLMVSKEGEEMRKRAVELGSVARRSVEEGGASHLDFGSLIAHITR
ncbi:zeatin O-glucosyltransferase-like [Actinidia eriantha]|uniref:zeatin O-glucosyltransferase-like n=1 Tax=Actinidia eriantha TaxID=165200 RepID=UPI00258D6F22|nr:zeatin O-glucosyltransferase-like [Actinidia eriantha]